MKKLLIEMKICRNCKYWNKEEEDDGVDYGYCANPDSEYHESFTAEEGGCAEWAKGEL